MRSTGASEAPVVLDRSTGALDVLKRHPRHPWSIWRWSSTSTAISRASSLRGDVLEAITGAFQDEDGRRAGVSSPAPTAPILVAGWMQVDEFSQAHLGVPCAAKDADYQTVAGFVLAEMNRLPAMSARVSRSGHWRFEVVDLDGRRIDKLLVSRVD
jgi:putative hemolysin